MSWQMKAIFLFVVLNAYAGAFSLITFPASTENTFFWKINPPISAAMFGGLYLVAGTAVLLAVLRGKWESARYLTPMVIFFGSLILLTSFIHLDKFDQSPKIFYWLAVYIVAPLAGIIFFVQHERGKANWQVVTEPIRPAARILAVVVGTMAAIFVLVCFFSPNILIDNWPWPITPLMVRTFGSWISALAGGLLWFAVEKDWKRMSNLVTMVTVFPYFMLLMLVIHSNDLKPDNISVWIFAASLVGFSLCGGLLLWLQRRPVGAPSLAN
jgi:hypothetical protein